MKTKVPGRKQSYILITITIVGLISLAGLIVDSGKVYINRRIAQNAAASAAQAAALALARGQDVTTAAQLNAANAGFDNDGTQDRVIVNNPPAIGCNGKNSTQVGDTEYVQVIIQSNLSIYFAQVVGIRETYICVEDIEHAMPLAYSLSD